MGWAAAEFSDEELVTELTKVKGIGACVRLLFSLWHSETWLGLAGWAS